MNCAVKLKILRNLFKMATRQGMITHNPAEAVDVPRGVRHTREPFTIPELQALLQQADPNWKAMILLGAYAGMRLGDAACLTWNNVDLEQKKITYLPKKKAHQPGVKKVTVPIHCDLLQALLELPVNAKQPNTPTFPIIRSHHFRRSKWPFFAIRRTPHQSGHRHTSRKIAGATHIPGEDFSLFATHFCFHDGQ